MLTLNEALKVAGIKKLNEDSEGKATISVSTPGMGQVGTIITVTGGAGVTALAELLGVPDGWKLTKVGNGFAAYVGDELQFLSDRRDHQPLDEED